MWLCSATLTFKSSCARSERKRNKKILLTIDSNSLTIDSNSPQLAADCRLNPIQSNIESEYQSESIISSEPKTASEPSSDKRSHEREEGRTEIFLRCPIFGLLSAETSPWTWPISCAWECQEEKPDMDGSQYEGKLPTCWKMREGGDDHRIDRAAPSPQAYPENVDGRDGRRKNIQQEKPQDATRDAKALKGINIPLNEKTP